MALFQVKVKNLVEGVSDHPQSGWLGFSAMGGKKQWHDSALIGAGVEKHPIKKKIDRIRLWLFSSSEPYGLLQRFQNQ